MSKQREKTARGKSCPSKGKKGNSCGKTGHFAEESQSKLSNNNTSNSSCNTKRNHHADSGQLSENGTKVGMFFFVSKPICMATACESVIIDGTEVKMQGENGDGC